jgi:hypothetical protein
MRNFFQPASGPTWLGQVLASIRSALGDIWPVPLRLKDYATADLPSAADFSGGLVFDLTTTKVNYSTGAAWVPLSTTTGTVTSVSVVTANGVSGSVANPTTTPAITLTLGAITPTSVAASGAVTGSNLSGTNTGDQTITLTGNVTGSGTGSFATTIAPGVVTLAMQANMTTASVVYRKTAGSGAPEINTLATLKTDLGLTGTNSGDQTITLTGDATGSGTGSFAVTVGKINGVALSGLATGILKNTTTTGAPSIAVAADFPTLNQNTTGSAATLTTARNIDGQAFDGSAAITVIAPGTHAATSKVTPVDVDEIPMVDSAASNVLKKLTWANLKATLKTYFDTLYQGVQSTGSWTPVLNLGGATTGITYSNQSGQYVKIGSMVIVTGAIILTSKGSATGAATITGLPFTVSGNAPGVFTDGNNVAAITAPYVVANGTTLYMRQHGATAYSGMDNTNFTNTSSFNFSAVYTV